MTDLRERMPAQALMERLLVARAEGQIRDLPLGIVMLSKDALAWLRGIRGELDVAARLARLGDGWTVLHSVPIGRKQSDIDHIAIGPGGVFTINSKRHVDKAVWVAGSTYLVSGQRTQYLRNSEHEARRVKSILFQHGIDVPVVPVIAVSGAKTLTIKAQPTWDGVPILVTGAAFLRRRLARRKGLTAQAASEIAALVSRPEMWQASERHETSPAELVAAYRYIDRGYSRFRFAAGSLLLAALAAVTLTCAQIAGLFG